MTKVHLLLFLLWLLSPQGQDDTILERGEKLLEEAKALYEAAHGKSEVATFVEAGFKLEEARIKFIVLQEIGSPDKQKIATDRLRAVNQLGKLIHDGKVAISGTPVTPPDVKPDNPAPSAPAEPAKPEPVLPAVDVTKRFPAPDAAKQKDTEKTVRELFKDQYAKKSPADRRALSHALLNNASRSQEDPVAYWVLCREAHDAAVQTCDVRTAFEAVDTMARLFDVDSLALKNLALAAATKSARTPEDSGELATALLRLVDDLIAADQYDAADKDCIAAVQHARKANDTGLTLKTTMRAKEVAEAKTLYQGMKNVLETIAKTPDDPGANLETGKFLCFAKGAWDLGLRFLVKGSDATLKGLAEKELGAPIAPADRLVLADGWYELADKEKSPLRKSRMLAHCRVLYESALPDAPPLARIKIQKRLDELDAALGTPGTVNLLSLIDPSRHQTGGEFRKSGEGLITPAGAPFARVEVAYQPPAEYDLALVVVRKSGTNSFIVGLIADGTRFAVMFDAGPGGDASYLDQVDSRDGVGQQTGTSGKFLEIGKPATILVSVRKSLLTATVNGKKLIQWKGDYKRVGFDKAWMTPQPNAMILGSWGTEFVISKALLTPVSGPGKRLR
jgi:hypothetical protein